MYLKIIILLQIVYHNGYIGMASRQCLFSYILQDKESMRMPYHKGCIKNVSPQLELSGVFLLASLCLVFKTYYTSRNHDWLEYKMALDKNANTCVK